MIKYKRAKSFNGHGQEENQQKYFNWTRFIGKDTETHQWVMFILPKHYDRRIIQ